MPPVPRSQAQLQTLLPGYVRPARHKSSFTAAPDGVPRVNSQARAVQRGVRARQCKFAVFSSICPGHFRNIRARQRDRAGRRRALITAGAARPLTPRGVLAVASWCAEMENVRKRG
jgi:hypothetical protein